MIIMGAATGPTYKVAFRRRLKNLTNYSKRLELIKSDEPRMVVRLSNRHILIQIIKFNQKGDQILAVANSKELEKQGWHSTTNTPTAYLTGALVAKKAKNAKIKKVHLDIGMKTATVGGVVFAAAYGAKENGLEISIKDDIIINDRISAKHIAEFAKALKEKNKDIYEKQFSGYIRKKIDPLTLPQLFEKVKGQIMEGK